METLLTNAYTRLDEKSKLFETSSVAIGTKELLQKKKNNNKNKKNKKKSTSKNIFYYKITF